MRKFTLFLMSLFLTVGAMAQMPKPILELTADQIGRDYPYELSEDDANTVFALKDALTVAVKINTPESLSGRKSLFATSDPTQVANTSAKGINSYYVGYGLYDRNLAYLASWVAGDRFSTRNNVLTLSKNDVMVVYVINKEENTYKMYVNGVIPESGSYVNANPTGFMNGYEIATPGMVKEDYENAKIYIGGAKNKSGVSEVFNGVITNVKVYDRALTDNEVKHIDFVGNYYRLQGISGNYIDASSIYNNATAKVGQMSMKSDANCNLAGTIFYFNEERNLLNYATGTYTRDTREIGAINDNTKSIWTIDVSSRDSQKFVLTDTNTTGSKNLHDNSGNRADKCSSVCGNRHDFSIVKVTSLPVTITAAKYATFYAPVAVEVPEGVTAHTVTINGKWATLSEALEVIPANTGVVLYSETAATYNFAITDDVEAIEGNALRGSAAATYYTAAGTYYALGLVDGEVGFYRDEFKNNHFQNNSHKAYLYVEGTQNAASYSFRFQDGTTAIENVEVENEVKGIYDLTGRRVEAITAPGIYIVGGKKVLVK